MWRQLDAHHNCFVSALLQFIPVSLRTCNRLYETVVDNNKLMLLTARMNYCPKNSVQSKAIGYTYHRLRRWRWVFGRPWLHSSMLILLLLCKVVHEDFIVITLFVSLVKRTHFLTKIVTIWRMYSLTVFSDNHNSSKSNDSDIGDDASHNSSPNYRHDGSR